MSVRYLLAGERGLVVEFGNAVSLEINSQVRALALGIEAARIPGIIEVVPTYRSLGIQYDPAVMSFDDLVSRVGEVLARVDSAILPPPKRVEIPAVYGGTYGPDLPFVAQHARLSEAEVVRLHSEMEYPVYMIGFTAGFAYMGGLPERLHTPRLTSPRTRVPRGSVGIGGAQTGAYPAETPGGWRIIGRTYLDLFDPSKEVPTPIQPGDTVRFVPITEEEYLSAGRRAPGAEGGEPRAAHPEGTREMPSVTAGGARPSNLGAQGSIEVLHPGLLTTVQDRGRAGYQKFGVTASGGVDTVALQVANILVGNPRDAAALEFAALGPSLRFLSDAVVALTGGEFAARLEGRPVPWYESFLVRAGQVLEIQGIVRGFRGYLAIGGGIDVPVLLRSRSTCLAAKFGGYRGRRLAAGDVLAAGSCPTPGLVGCAAPPRWHFHREDPATVRVLMGPQDDAFTDEGQHTFLSAVYRVTPDVDRMGCRLDGPAITHRSGADIISDWIPLGGVQVPGSGKPIVLLADRQTTGGYTKIATVIGPDLGLVAQSQPGDALRFQAVSVTQAQEAARELETALAELPGRLFSDRLWAGHIES